LSQDIYGVVEERRRIEAQKSQTKWYNEIEGKQRKNQTMNMFPLEVRVGTLERQQLNLEMHFTKLEENMTARLQEILDDIHEGIAQEVQYDGEMEKYIGERFNAVEEHLKRHDERFNLIEERLKQQAEYQLQFESQMDNRFNQIKEQFKLFGSQIDERFKQVDERFKQVDERFKRFESQIDKRFKQIDARFEKLEGQMDTRFKQMDARFEKVETLLAYIIERLPGK
jgi:DNA anti-recombination protein RmuC